MVCNLPELSLDLSPPVVNTYSVPDFLKKFPATPFGNFADLTNLDEFITGLEVELQKIRAFQRELPLSSFLLNDAVGKLKEKARKCEERRQIGKFSENAGPKSGFDVRDKRNWMSSAQLWSPRNEDEERRKKTEGGAISSFKVDDKVAGLSLLPPAAVEPGCKKAGGSGVSPGSEADQTVKPLVKPGYQASRKQRRSWSPELHRRFVDALEKLGGPQVATPKQIRELMQVEGLTNDEVKSHLQKYRLHVRKLPGAASTRTASSTDEDMGGDKLGLGGYSNLDTHCSGSPEGPLHFAVAGKCKSYDLEDEDEEKSDGHSWKAQQHL